MAARDALELAQVVCTRLCHDIGGPTGALSGALELLEGQDDDAIDVARDAATVIDRRLRFWRAAAGGVGQALDAASLAQLAEGLTLGRRAAIALDGLASGVQVPVQMAQPLLLAMLLGTEALPRGGVVRVSGDPSEGFAVEPQGAGAAWPPGIATLLAGESGPVNPRGLALPLLALVAAAGKVRVELADRALVLRRH